MRKITAFGWCKSLCCACATLMWLATSLVAGFAADPKLAAVYSNGVPAELRGDYFDVLKDFSRESIQAFLINLGLSPAEAQSEIDTVDFDMLGDHCLGKSTLYSIYQAIKSGCSRGAVDPFIFSFILPKLDGDKKTISIIFFPYGLNQLKSAPISPNSVVTYQENFPNPASREWTEALVVVGFLNLYWDNLKAKPKLSNTEFLVIYRGFGKYQVKLNKLCAQLPDPAQKDGCKVIADDAGSKAYAALGKSP